MSKHNDIYNILGKLNSLQPKEEPTPSILKEFAEPPVMKDLTTRLNERYLAEKGKITRTATGLRHEKTDWEGNPSTFKDTDSDKPNMAHVNKMDNALGVKFDREKKFQGGVKVDEYFHFDPKPGKDRGPRDTGTDELERRSKLGKDPLVKHGKEYKEKDKHGDAYKIGGPKGHLPENEQVDEISQGLAGSYMDAAEKDIKSRKEKDARDPKISKRKEGKFHAVLRKTGTVPTTDNPTHGKFLQRESEMDEDMLSPKQKKFAALADPKDKITYADKIAGAKKKVVDEEFEDQDSIENKGEYDQEGDMAKDDLSTIEDAANELDSILSADDDLPEWVQSKINKAMDYLDTARDYMKANADDDNPELDEGEYQDSVNKSKIPAYKRKEKGGDWKVSQQDLDDEASKSPTSRVGLEKAKQRLRDQGVMEGFPTVADAKARHEKEKGTGKFDKQTTSTGTRYTRKPETYADDNEETGTSDAPKKKGRPKKNTGPERVTSKAWKHKGGRKVKESIKLDTFVEDTMAELDALMLSEKAVSKQQQKFMGMVHAMQKGEKVKGASKELKAAAKGMSKKDAKDFASTKHKGLPRKVSEGINFAEMMRETDQTVEEMLNELHSELDEYKRSGHMGDKLRDALDLHRHSKNKLMGETQQEKERDDFFYNPDVPNDQQLPALPDEVKVDVELDELARLAGLGEMDRGDYISQQDKAAERSGKDSFNAFGQIFKTDEINESGCNMTAEGEYCPEHGMNECGSMMYEGKGKPDFLDLDKDGDKKEPMKKAAKDKKELDECGMPGDMSPMSSMSQEQSGMNINSSMDTKTGRKTLSVTADGEAAEQLAQMLKMAGLGSDREHDHHDMEQPEHKHQVMLIKAPGSEQEVEEDFSNEPNQQYATADNITNAGQDLNRKKKQYADKPKAGDNPMATEDVMQLEGKLAALYNSIKVKTK